MDYSLTRKLRVSPLIAIETLSAIMGHGLEGHLINALTVVDRNANRHLNLL